MSGQPGHHSWGDAMCQTRPSTAYPVPGVVCRVCYPEPEPIPHPSLSPLLGVVEDPTDRVSYPRWFHDWVDANAGTIAAKAEEYGTNSLVEMGRIFARAQGREIEEQEAVELGCFLYAYGKMQRVADAALKGSTPSYDTWSDLLVYASMAMFSRENGRWP